MPPIAWELLILFLLIAANGAFALSEIALVSARKNRLEQLRQSGSKGAAAALELTEDPNRFLSTVQVGITLVGTLAGVFGGARFAGILADWLDQAGMPSAYADDLSLVLVVVGITYLSLTIGELVPKRLALSNPEKLACLVAVPMKGLARLATPAVVLLSASTNFILWLLPFKPVPDVAVTEEDIRALIQQGTKTGALTEEEQEMLDRLLRLDDRRVSVLMTPRRDIVYFDVEATREEVLEAIHEHRYSRYPVCEGSIDNVTGIVHLRDLYTAQTAGSLNLRELMVPPLYVLESTRALRLLRDFKASGIHLAIVHDEFGGVEGLVTINDIFESIVGTLPEAGETEEPAVIRRQDGSLLVNGSLPVDELRQLVAECPLEDLEEAEYETLGGFIMTKLGRIPLSGDYFDCGSVRFEVVDMDERRVDKVLIQVLASVTVPEEGEQVSSDVNGS